MESSLTYTGIAALSGIMVTGAMIPGVSVLAVSARSAAFGFAHGVFTSLGIVLGDIVFILTAIYGLSVLAELMGNNFILIKYTGGAYLVWLGMALWRSKSRPDTVEENNTSSMVSSFMAGLLVTLGDTKAIFFYLGLFPAFLDLSTISLSDTGIIIVIAVVAVGGPKLVYAYAADRAGKIFQNTRAAKAINIVAGSVMLAAGVSLIATA